MNIRRTAILVDDESLSLAVIANYLKLFPEIEILGQYTKSRQALEKISILKPDLIFLDVQMPGLNGFELLQALQGKHHAYIIFTTAYDQYAIQAFDVNAIGYLLKPISQEKFNQSIQKYLDLPLHQGSINYDQLLHWLKPSNESVQTMDKLMIKENKRIFYLPVQEVIYFEAAGDYVKVICEKQSHLIHESLSSLELALSAQEFVRIHRSHIIQAACVKEFIPYFNGEYQVVMKNQHVLKMSRNYKEQAARLFKGL